MGQADEKRARLIRRTEMMNYTGFCWYEGRPGKGLHDQPAYMTRERIYIDRWNCLDKTRMVYENGRMFRLWTGKPTQEQRDNAAWDSWEAGD